MAKAAGILVPVVLDWCTNAREMASRGEGRNWRGGGRGGVGRREEGRCGRRTGVLGGWVLVRFSRGKRRRGVRAASGWCIIDPSVCGLGKKRSLRLGPRKRRSDTPPAYEGEKETPPRRVDRSRRQILEMRSPVTRHAAASADESAAEESREIHPRCGEFTPGWIISSRWRSKKVAMRRTEGGGKVMGKGQGGSYTKE